MRDKLKICMLGATAVGKTSLVARFMSSIFHERYATTIGVKIQTRPMARGSKELDLILWDLSGEDEFAGVQPAYLRGAAGYLLVIDGTRRKTLSCALSLQERARATVGPIPFVAVLNKADLAVSWDIDPQSLEELRRRGFPLVTTSAKTGDRVGEAFNRLVDAILDRQGNPWS
jgi:small GTP-binding protein